MEQICRANESNASRLIIATGIKGVLVMSVPTIQWKNNCIRLIDQTRLPGKFVQIECRTVKSLWWAIKKLKVRGAPALGIAGALGILLGIKNCKARSSAQLISEIKKIKRYLGSSRPTAVNLFWAMERMLKFAEDNAELSPRRLVSILKKEAFKIIEEDKTACRRMADYGARLIKNRDCVLTHCNAGGLATYDYGTALGVFFRARELGKRFTVYVDETRPLLQGARLTMWELMGRKIPCRLICDNMAAGLMAKGKINKIFVGADRIAGNGDFANKTGTYCLAVAAHYHRIPLYVVAPVASIDFSLASGESIPIEQRNPDEIRSFAGCPTAPRKALVWNPAFDVTPANLVTAIITEKGILRAPYGKAIKKLRS